MAGRNPTQGSRAERAEAVSRAGASHTTGCSSLACISGYRRLKGRKGRPAVAGKWVTRHYVGGRSYVVEKISIGDNFPVMPTGRSS